MAGSAFADFETWTNKDGKSVQLDLIKVTVDVLDGHAGSPFYYLNILQKHHYDWLAAGLLSWLLFPIPWSRIRDRIRTWRPGSMSHTAVVLAAWVGVCAVIPSAMQTKLPWYLNPLYPAVALAVGWSLSRSLSRPALHLRRGRRRALYAIVVVALGVAEGKFLKDCCSPRRTG